MHNEIDFLGEFGGLMCTLIGLLANELQGQTKLSPRRTGMDSPSIHTCLSLTEHRSRIFAVVVSMVQDYDLAEDLFQETISEILRSESTFDSSRGFVSWSCGVARNVVRQHWRRQQNAPTNGVCDLLSEFALVVEEADDDVWKRERRALRSCFQQLPHRMQKLLMFRYGHNVKGKALADAVDIRLGSIRTTLARLRKQLRSCIRSRSLDLPTNEA
ncbi:MAG: sigma-70 family RNA polymerase sigma factor [Planctomycetota bacterium]